MNAFFSFDLFMVYIPECHTCQPIGSGAKNDLTRHAKSQNHMQLEMVQRKSKSMSLFVTMPNNSLKSKTTSAETQFCNFIATSSFQ
jgi:hypothetical protein